MIGLGVFFVAFLLLRFVVACVIVVYVMFVGRVFAVMCVAVIVWYDVVWLCFCCCDYFGVRCFSDMCWVCICCACWRVFLL